MAGLINLGVDPGAEQNVPALGTRKAELWRQLEQCK